MAKQEYDANNINEVISNKDKGYFAAKPSEDAVTSLEEKIYHWYTMRDRLGYTSKILDLYSAWHGAYNTSIGDAHQITFGGEDGELVELSVNHLRNLGQHMLNMITSTRPAMECRAVNPDSKSQIQVKLGNSLLDYYMREKKLESFFKQAAEYALALAGGWVKLGWNAKLGKVTNQKEITEAMKKKMVGMDVEIPAKEFEGDVEFDVISGLDVIEDMNKSPMHQKWRICRTFKNRFDLMAKYPDLQEEIEALEEPTFSSIRTFRSVSYDKQSDDVAVYEFFRERTEALPDGRYMIFSTSDTVYFDGPLPYRRIPLIAIRPATILGSALGYSPLFDLLPIQDGVNTLYSTILTNQSALGVQNILVPSGTNIEPSQLSSGLNIIKYNAQAGKPEALNLTQTPQEIFKFLDMLINAMETVSGINSVVRGNPEANVRSGSAVAMLQSNSIQYMSAFQAEYTHLIEDVGICLIEILIDYANSPIIASIVGMNNKSYMKEFKGEDLAEINRVVVDSANHLSKTLSGRVNMADNLLQYQAINAQQYQNVINTGNIETATDPTIRLQMLIQSENEAIMNGQEVQASAFDSHLEHIMGHRTVIDDFDLRQDAQLVELTMNHIQQHIDLLKTVKPEVLQALGQQPIAPDAAPAPEGQPAPEGAPAAPEAPAAPAPMGDQANAAPANPQALPPVDQAVSAQGAVPNLPRIPEEFGPAPLNGAENLERMGRI